MDTNNSCPRPEHQRIETLPKSTAKPPNNDDSDDELSGRKMRGLIPLCNFSAVETTVSCKSIGGNVQNIKGGTLILSVYITVRSIYDKAIEGIKLKILGEAPARFENVPKHINQLPDTISTMPEVTEKGVIHIRKSGDWILSLGKWKGQVPNEEIIEPRKYSGAKLFDTEFFFPIKDGRLHICKQGQPYEIHSHIVTKKPDYKKKLFVTQTDLSYSQIIEAISYIKKNSTGIEGKSRKDAELAKYQISLLDNQKSELTNGIEIKGLFTGLSDLRNQQINNQIKIFFHFLNALMFGMESTGLNAGILTSLMTLELIAQGKLTYEQALYHKPSDSNQPDGYYPFANFNNNRETYQKREIILLGSKQSSKYSMKECRKSIRKYRESMRKYRESMKGHGERIKSYSENIEKYKKWMQEDAERLKDYIRRMEMYKKKVQEDMERLKDYISRMEMYKKNEQEYEKKIGGYRRRVREGIENRKEDLKRAKACLNRLDERKELCESTEKKLAEDKKRVEDYKMKAQKYSKRETYSPVALKEAFITKFWLDANKHLDDSLTFDEQTKVIQRELEKLVDRHLIKSDGHFFD